MQAHTVERVESWGSRPFSGGYRELHELADREFSGAVVADDAWLFMLNGRVIGIFEGDIEDFEDHSGTVYEAPDPSLALLFSMQERGGETQAKYYTNDTPLSEADRTLSDANFTGYIELSENVLSGDYYVVYYGGRSMSAAFVGTSEDLITGDEAFERADDEVGVYEVLKTPVNVTSIPEVDDDEDDAAGAAGAAGGTAGAASGAAGAAGAGGSDSDNEDTAGADDQPADPTARDRSEGTTDITDSASADPGAETATDPASDVTVDAASSPAESADDSDDEAASASRPDSSAVDASTRETESSERNADSPDPSSTRGERTEAAAGEETDQVFDEEAEWRNATSVPTLDPEKSESTDGGATETRSSKPASKKRSSAKDRSNTQQPSKQPSKQPESTQKNNAGMTRADASENRKSTVDKLKRAVKQRDAKLEEAADRIQSLEGERDDLQARVQSLQDDRDQLRERVDSLEAELDAVDSGSEEDAVADGPTLSPDAALSGTNLFVRYGSKGKPTLDGLDSTTEADAVNANLRIDHHTQFEAAEATVNGEDFESFLESTASYRFVSWAVRELPYEIRDAGHADGLAELYGAIPDIDRAELDGTVEVETEDGSTTRDFDVVLRDRMGEPLVVAELNAERDPVTGVEMDDLVDAATTVREGVAELSAAMYVTASFFEPAALETAAEETGGGGFLSRSDRRSFVSVGRKAGYHLCLVEDRNDAFHLTVPEL